jgi:hypothetical protein
MYNILHSANSAGASDAFRPREGRLLRGRARRRRRGGLTGVEAGGLVEGRRLVALGEHRVAGDRLDEVLR